MKSLILLVEASKSVPSILPASFSSNILWNSNEFFSFGVRSADLNFVAILPIS